MRKPIILLDKSALHSLSSDELKRLEKHFFVNLPPILVFEILADLRKKNGHNLVAGLSSKLRTLNSIPSHDWRTLCAGSLLGDQIPMGKVPTNANLHISEDGRVEYGSEPHPTIKAIDDWKSGLISNKEIELALAWKGHAKSSIDLESFMKSALESFATSGFTLKFDSVQHLRIILDEFIRQPDSYIQETLLESMLAELDLGSAFRDRVLDRWNVGGNQVLKTFAPYANECVRTFLIFWFALRDGIITPKNTNRIDLEYFFYSPFCDWFVSNDKFHKALYLGVLDASHTFAEGTLLKRELNAPELIRLAQFNLELPVFFS